MLFEALKGVRVLDMSQFLPGPYAAQMLADLGADVVKVEPPAGDPMLGLDPVSGGSDGAAFYQAVNAGKRLLRLDLKSERGREVLEALLARADVLIESYRPGVLDRLGFGRARLEELNHRLVHCALSGYGQDGPDRLAAGHDIDYMASCGALSATGGPNGPAIPWPPVADHASAMQTVVAALGGLLARGNTGRGCFIDIGMADAALAWQAWGLTASLGRSMGPGRDLLNGGAACYNVYATADGRHAVLGALEGKFWRAFCEAVGRPDWIARQGEPLPQTVLIGELRALFAEGDLAAWRARFAGVDCCFRPVATYGEVFDDPQVTARGLLRRGTEPAPHVEVAFAALVDGRAMADRVAIREIGTDEALSRWNG